VSKRDDLDTASVGHEHDREWEPSKHDAADARGSRGRVRQPIEAVCDHVERHGLPEAGGLPSPTGGDLEIERARALAVAERVPRMSPASRSRGKPKRRVGWTASCSRATLSRMDESRFVSTVAIPGGRYKIVVGLPEDQVVVAELDLGRSEELLVELRRVLASCIDRSVDERVRRYEERHTRGGKDGLEEMDEAADSIRDDALGAIDDYIRRRGEALPGRPFGKCCRSTASDVKALLRERLG